MHSHKTKTIILYLLKDKISKQNQLNGMWHKEIYLRLYKMKRNKEGKIS